MWLPYKHHIRTLDTTEKLKNGETVSNATSLPIRNRAHERGWSWVSTLIAQSTSSQQWPPHLPWTLWGLGVPSSLAPDLQQDKHFYFVEVFPTQDKPRIWQVEKFWIAYKGNTSKRCDDVYSNFLPTKRGHFCKVLFWKSYQAELPGISEELSGLLSYFVTQRKLPTLSLVGIFCDAFPDPNFFGIPR